MAETGGFLFRVPAISSARAMMSVVRTTRSSSLLLSWRGVVSALAVAPVDFAFGVLVAAWALELVCVALVVAGSWRLVGTQE